MFTDTITFRRGRLKSAEKKGSDSSLSTSFMFDKQTRKNNMQTIDEIDVVV